MKRKHKSIISLMLIFFTATTSLTYAQNTIKGKVIDAASRQPLENVSITIADATTSGTLTDLYGNFNIKILFHYP